VIHNYVPHTFTAPSHPEAHDAGMSGSDQNDFVNEVVGRPAQDNEQIYDSESGAIEEDDEMQDEEVEEAPEDENSPEQQ
jgi:hypothetical protein